MLDRRMSICYRTDYPLKSDSWRCQMSKRYFGGLRVPDPAFVYHFLLYPPVRRGVMVRCEFSISRDCPATGYDSAAARSLNRRPDRYRQAAAKSRTADAMSPLAGRYKKWFTKRMPGSGSLRTDLRCELETSNVAGGVYRIYGAEWLRLAIPTVLEPH